MKKHRHNRRSIRMRGYDYSQAGAYFVTLCTHNRECLFGNVENGAIALNDAGDIAADCWLRIPEHFPNVELDEWVIMPNHVHGILVITDPVVGALGIGPVGAKDFSPLPGQYPPPPRPIPPPPGQRPTGTARTLGSIVRGYKIGVTKWYRQQLVETKIWQRNYWEHIIRDELEMDRIRRYIGNNPANWVSDSLKGLDAASSPEFGETLLP